MCALIANLRPDFLNLNFLHLNQRFSHLHWREVVSFLHIEEFRLEIILLMHCICLLVICITYLLILLIFLDSLSFIKIEYCNVILCMQFSNVMYMVLQKLTRVYRRGSVSNIFLRIGFLKQMDDIFEKLQKKLHMYLHIV